MERKQIEVDLSARIVAYLQQQGMTLRRIAEMMDLSESFLSRVANKKRSLTIEHLLRIEGGVGIPLPLLLLEVTSQDEVPAHLAPLYERTRSALQAASDLQPATGEAKGSRKRRAREAG